MVNVGGFFASLALLTDEDSFKKGIGALTAVGEIGKKGAVGVLALGGAMIGLGAATANSMTKLAAMAKQLGMNALTLDNWQNAVKLAGGDSEAFTASIVNMNEAFRNLKIGEVKEDFIKATGMSGADFSKLQGMNNDQRLRAIWGALSNVTDPGKQQALVQKIFGAGGVDLLSRMQLQGTTLNQLYNQAAAMNPNTQSDYDAAVKGAQDNASIMVSFEKTIAKLGIEIEKALLPELDAFAAWLRNNKDELTAFSVAVGNITASLVTFLGFLGGSQKAKDQMAQGMMGGALKAAVFSQFESQLGIKKDSAAEGTLFLTLWSDPNYQAIVKRAEDLSKGGLSSSAAASQAFQENQAARVRSTFAGTGLSDATLAALYGETLRAKQGNVFLNENDYSKKQAEAVHKAEITLKIDGSKPLSSRNEQMLIEALAAAGVLSVRQ